MITIYRGEVIENLATGVNGPYVMGDMSHDLGVRALTLWTEAASGSSIAVNRTANNAHSSTQAPSFPMTQVGSDTGYYENTDALIGDPGFIWITVTGSAAGCSWGIR